MALETDFTAPGGSVAVVVLGFDCHAHQATLSGDHGNCQHFMVVRSLPPPMTTVLPGRAVVMGGDIMDRREGSGALISLLSRTPNPGRKYYVCNRPTRCSFHGELPHKYNLQSHPGRRLEKVDLDGWQCCFSRLTSLYSAWEFHAKSLLGTLFMSQYTACHIQTLTTRTNLATHPLHPHIHTLYD